MRLISSFTLKKRIITMMMLVAVIALAFVGGISYYAISDNQELNMQSAFASNLRQVRLAMENTISNMNHVSQQFTSEGSVGEKLVDFNNSKTSYERASLLDEIRKGMNLIIHTNPNIGMCAYFPANTDLGYVGTSYFKDELPPKDLPLLDAFPAMSYYGPHISLDRLSNQYVLSVIRKLDLPGDNKIYVYIETSYNYMKRILANDMDTNGISHLMLDNQGLVVYSENLAFPIKSNFGISESETGMVDGFRWYKTTSNQGWSLVSVISDTDFNKQKQKWLNSYLMFVPVFALLSFMVGYFLWSMINKPMRSFDKDIKMIMKGDYYSSPDRTGIHEFDQLLGSLFQMKRQIGDLIADIGRKEKSRADMEIEKLRSQINPHFLMNTLNTVHWLAITNNQPDIDRVIQALNKLLIYNLNKSDHAASLRDELAALQDYLTIQRMRYNVVYVLNNLAGDDILDITMPRFLLQPIVENSIRHVTSNEPRIEITINCEDDHIRLQVEDNGPGIPEEVSLQFQEDESHTMPAMGIGLSYVKLILESFYHGKARMTIKRRDVGKGAFIILDIPYERPASNDSCADC
jgi:two-component system sensor histidine kinase YesM